MPFTLARHLRRRELARAPLSAGIRMPSRRAMMAMTTRSSVRVKAGPLGSGEGPVGEEEENAEGAEQAGGRGDEMRGRRSMREPREKRNRGGWFGEEKIG